MVGKEAEDIRVSQQYIFKTAIVQIDPDDCMGSGWSDRNHRVFSRLLSSHCL